jgi:hypothetical protein
MQKTGRRQSIRSSVVVVAMNEAVKETIQWERNKFVWLHLKTLLLIAVFRDFKVLA